MSALSESQKNTLWNHNGDPIMGLRVVSARPGVGKTTLLSQYAKDILSVWNKTFKPWQGMALLSFTNVAASELFTDINKNYLADDGSFDLSNNNYIGTFDSFVNRFIFLPFGYLAMHADAQTRPILVGEPYSRWNPKRISNTRLSSESCYSEYLFCSYSYDSDENPLLIGPPNVQVPFSPGRIRRPKKPKLENLKHLKQYFWHRGVASQSDANYLSYELLKKNQQITRLLCKRFPVLLVDEAQDLTKTEHGIINELMGSGLINVILVGDEYQALYEWNTAYPELFVEKKKGEFSFSASSDLNETFRCSPEICKVLTTLANDGNSIIPVGKNGSYSAPVELQGYPEASKGKSQVQKSITLREQIKNLANSTSALIPHSGDNPSMAVLAKSNQDVRDLHNLFVPSEAKAVCPSPMAMSAFEFVCSMRQSDLYSASVHYLTLVKRVLGISSNRRLIEKVQPAPGAESLHQIIEHDLKVLFKLNWNAINQISDLPHQIPNLKLLSTSNLDLIRNELTDSYGLSATLVQQSETDLASYTPDKASSQNIQRINGVDVVFSTIHGVKGRTFDSVFLYLKKRGKACGCINPNTKVRISTSLTTKQLSHSITLCEQKRGIYVAISRAAQLLHLSVPDVSITDFRKELAL